jgi:N-methylhydantoinase B
MEGNKPMKRVAVDTGGTFTDIVYIDEDNMWVVVDKVPTTPHNLSQAVLEAIRKIEVDMSGVTLFIHGTTAGLNIIAQRKGARVGLITTKGFIDILEMARGSRKEIYNYLWKKTKPLVPRYLRCGVSERVNYLGEIVEKLDEAGVEEIVKKLRGEGVETIDSCIREMYDHSERITRLAIEKIPDGTWTAEDFMDSNGIDLDKPIKIKVMVAVKGSNITIDFTGSDPEQKGPMNGLWVTTLSAARMAVKALTSPELPANEGSNRPIKVIAPKGCVYNAGPTAPCFLCGNVVSTILELINKALYKVLPERIPACSGGDVCGNGFFGIDPKTGRHWTTLASAAIGNGADFSSDGDNCTSHHSIAGGGGSGQGGSIELMEATYPLFIEKYELVQDSGGAGKYRGGLGSSQQIRLLAPATVFSFIEKAKSPHWGIDGGKAGLKNYALIRSKEKGEFEILKTSGMQLAEGDIEVATAGGGGGYGNPLERDPEAVRWDVINGFVSVEHARQDYGVVIDPKTFEIDAEATQRLRNSL